MGQTESREKQHLRKSANRDYRLPEARLKNRYDASDVQSSVTAYEASIDKVRSWPFFIFSFTLSNTNINVNICVHNSDANERTNNDPISTTI